MAITFQVKRIGMILIGIMMSSSTYALEPKAFINGWQHYKLKQLGQELPSEAAFKAGLFRGFVEASSSAAARLGIICPEKGVDYDQITHIVSLWIEKNPAYWHKSPAAVTSKAIKDVYPCRTEQTQRDTPSH